MLQSLLDLLGVFAFALSGGTRAVERRLDLFGVLFLAFVAATTGGGAGWIGATASGSPPGARILPAAGDGDVSY